MPEINLPKSKGRSGRVRSDQNPVTPANNAPATNNVQQNPQPQPPSQFSSPWSNQAQPVTNPTPPLNSWGAAAGNNNAGWNNDPWGDPWGMSAPSSTEKRLTPQERVGMIEMVYESVLGRKPDTRDINYYKYSTLGEEEIRKQLIDGKEHKQLIEDGREFKKVKIRAEQGETRIKMLEGQIKDQVEEFKQLTQLLNEKNRYIQYLRSTVGNAFRAIGVQEQPIEPATYPEPVNHIATDMGVLDSTPVYAASGPTPVKTSAPSSRKPTPGDQIVEKIRSVFSL